MPGVSLQVPCTSTMRHFSHENKDVIAHYTKQVAIPKRNYSLFKFSLPGERAILHHTRDPNHTTTARTE